LFVIPTFLLASSGCSILSSVPTPQEILEKTNSRNIFILPNNYTCPSGSTELVLLWAGMDSKRLEYHVGEFNGEPFLFGVKGEINLERDKDSLLSVMKKIDINSEDKILTNPEITKYHQSRLLELYQEKKNNNQFVPEFDPDSTELSNYNSSL